MNKTKVKLHSWLVLGLFTKLAK